jgi:putative phosphoesterase
MKIGILSDTHKKVGRAKKAIDLLISKNVDYIIHAGDIVKIEILEYLKNSGISYIAVYGNNDRHLLQYHNDFNLVQEPHYFKIQEISFKLMHHPYFMTNDVDVVIYGHLHISNIQKHGETVFINPGETCARDRPVSKVAILDITEQNYEATLYERIIKEKEWTSKKFSFLKEL